MVPKIYRGIVLFVENFCFDNSNFSPATSKNCVLALAFLNWFFVWIQDVAIMNNYGFFLQKKCFPAFTKPFCLLSTFRRMTSSLRGAVVGTLRVDILTEGVICVELILRFTQQSLWYRFIAETVALLRRRFAFCVELLIVWK